MLSRSFKNFVALQQHSQSLLRFHYRYATNTFTKDSNNRKKILITGANGNIACKMIQFWQNKHDMILIDKNEPTSIIDNCLGTAKIPHTFIQMDLSKNNTESMLHLLSTVDVICHFAVDRAQPDANWKESQISIDITNNLFLNCITHAQQNINKKIRILYASSNHTLGGYLNEGSTIEQCIERGFTENARFTSKTPMKPGTIYALPNGYFLDSTKYATAKMTAERLLHSMTEQYTNIEGIVARIGWVQPGINLPSTLEASGVSDEQTAEVMNETEREKDMNENICPPSSEAEIELYFKNMWLSNIDLIRLFESAVIFEPNGKQSQQRFYIVNGVSNNGGSRWSVENEIGYQPILNVHDFNDEMEQEFRRQQ